MSNSKLQDYQREFLRDFKRDNPQIQFFSYPEDGVTVGIRQTSHSMGEFTISIASNTEKKFRRKVGEYHVATRFVYNHTLPLRLNGYDMEIVAESIMNAVG